MMRQDTVQVSSLHDARSVLQEGDLVVPDDGVERSVSYMRPVKMRIRPQEAIEGPLLLDSLELLGAG